MFLAHAELRAIAQSCQSAHQPRDATHNEEDCCALEKLRVKVITLAEAEVRESELARKGWKEWVNESLNAGAGAVHKWTKVPEAWRPTTTLMHDGTVTSDPRELLSAERSKWGNAWKAVNTEPVIPVADRESLPQLGPEDLREASLKFNNFTAVSADGFHVCWWSANRRVVENYPSEYTPRVYYYL